MAKENNPTAISCLNEDDLIVITGAGGFIAGTNLFMIMDTRVDFDHEKAMAQLAKLPRQAEWEALVSKYQETNHDATAGEKWRALERIFKLGQKHEYKPEDDYIEEINSI